MLVQLIILLLSYKVLWLVEKFVLNHLTDTPIEKICNYYFFFIMPILKFCIWEVLTVVYVFHILLKSVIWNKGGYVV